MSSTDASTETSTKMADAQVMEMKLEVVVVPVSDVDRAQRFYQALGWRQDGDFVSGEDFRVVQMTPPGSPCSIIFGAGITSAKPGSAESMILVVYDIDEARSELVGRGFEVSEVFHDVGGVFHHSGKEGRVKVADPEWRSYASWASFTDPDGTGGSFKRSGRACPVGDRTAAIETTSLVTTPQPCTRPPI
jgi:catechol 2,3-dioxygenase-like lactoylglutathione lyase family enzyme